MLRIGVVRVPNQRSWRNCPHIDRVIGEGVENKAFLSWNRYGDPVILSRWRIRGGTLGARSRISIYLAVTNAILSLSDFRLLSGGDILARNRIRVTPAHTILVWWIGIVAGTHQCRDEGQQKKNMLVVHD